MKSFAAALTFVFSVTALCSCGNANSKSTVASDSPATASGSAQASQIASGTTYDCQADSQHYVTVMFLTPTQISFAVFNQVPGQVHNVLGSAAVQQSGAQADVFGSLTDVNGNALSQSEGLGSFQVQYADSSKAAVTSVVAMDLQGNVVRQYTSCAIDSGN